VHDVAVVGPMAQIILEIPPLPSLSSSTIRPPPPPSLWLLSLLGRRNRGRVMEISSIAVGGGDPVIDAGIESKFGSIMMMMMMTTTTLDLCGAGW
jgi:hypothetical protein